MASSLRRCDPLMFSLIEGSSLAHAHGRQIQDFPFWGCEAPLDGPAKAAPEVFGSAVLVHLCAGQQYLSVSALVDALRARERARERERERQASR